MIRNIIFALVAIRIISINAALASLPGSGTQEDPYRIESLVDFNEFLADSNYWDDHIRLETDVNLAGLTYSTAVIAPDINDSISGFQGTCFTGVFDGNGYKISNLTIDGGSYLALFGYSAGSVSNLALENVNISATGDYIGGLVGYNYYGNITACYCTGEISGNNSVGGLVGYRYHHDATITACYSTCEVSGSGERIGGLVGCNGRGDITSSYSTGSVSGNSTVGGLIGSNGYNYITNCYSVGAVSGNSSVGGLIGSNSGQVVSSFWDIETSGHTPVNVFDGMGLTTEQMKSAFTYSVNGWGGENWTIDDGNDYPHLAWENAVGEFIPEFTEDMVEMSGSGGEGDPWIIEDVNDLLLVGSGIFFWDKHYILNSNIDLMGVSCSPIGYNFYHPFTGSFDGNGFTISNLTIDGVSYVGLFGCIYYHGSVSNLGLENVSVCSTGDKIGGLVGYLRRGTITDCYSTGEVNGNDSVGGLAGTIFDGLITESYSSCIVNGNNSVGGLVGYTIDHAQITNCYTVCTINGNDYVGGLVGYGKHYGRIIDSYSNSEVSGIRFVGGLVGWNKNQVNDSYCCGSVIGQEYVGGLLGKSSASVYNCYSIAEVSGNSIVGGFVGDGWYIYRSFWDIEMSGQDGGRISGAIGLTTEQMKTAFTYTINRWGGETWTIDEGNDYPHLAWENAVGEFIPEFSEDMVEMSGSGSVEDPWVIEDVNDFLLVSIGTVFWGKHFILNADINMVGVSYAPIGYEEYNSFTGSLNGNGHIIRNLTVNGGDGLGLFGYIDSSGSVSNLGLEDINISGTGSYIGGLAGVNNGRITRCYSTGHINGISGFSKVIGGLVGRNEHGMISNCYSVGAVSGEGYYTGGLAGWNSDGAILNCYTAGNVDGNEYTGGLVGDNFSSGTVSNCYASGAVVGLSYRTGGLIGYNRGILSNCYASGAVDGNECTGGLVGYNSGILSNSYASGAVNGNDCTGGLVGYNGGISSNSYASGAVDGNDCTGGLVGYNYYTISNCYALGYVNGVSETGGLVGSSRDINDIIASFWDVNTTDQPTSAGGEGKSTPEMQTMSTFTNAGWDFVGETVNGLDDVWTIKEGFDYPKFIWVRVNLVSSRFPLNWYEVDFVDFAVMANWWDFNDCAINDDCNGADFDFSGNIDSADLDIFCSYWLEGIVP